MWTNRLMAEHTPDNRIPKARPLDRSALGYAWKTPTAFSAKACHLDNLWRSMQKNEVSGEPCVVARNRRFRRASLRGPYRRAGSIYIVAMGTSLIVVCLAVASLQAVRVQRRINEEMSQLANAKKLAQSGIEFAQQRILTDTNWRTFFTHGVPVSCNATGGNFSVTLIDPDDGLIANQTNDPIIVTSTGTFGSASQKLTAYLEPQSQLFAACRSALYAPTSVAFNACTITANQWAYSDSLVSASSNPVVNMNCMAGILSGSSSGYSQRLIQGGVWPMVKPDLLTTSSTYVGKYYIDNAVDIRASDLPTGGTELIKNAEFETDTLNWIAMNCTITRSTSQAKVGIASCLVSGQGFLSAPGQNISQQMIKGRNYNVSFWIRTTENQLIYPIISLSGSGNSFPVIKTGASVPALKRVWTQVSDTINVTWSGTLINAEFQIGSEKMSDYNFDTVSIIDADRVAGTRYIENVLLGNGNNPYGAQVVSPLGIYCIKNAGSDRILIRDSRINGTIVVQAAKKVELGNAISWEPCGRNFPALIANAATDDLTSIASLSEATIGVNLNPVTSPYLGVSDTNASGTYPSVINGPIVSTADILLNGLSTLSGPVLSGTNIHVTSSNLNINFPSDMILNPPPGFFADPPKMRLITSSVQSAP